MFRTTRTTSLAVAAFSAVAYARADYTDLDKSMQSFLHAATTTHVMLDQEFGLTNDSALSLSGQVTEAGWNLQLNGSHAGMPVALSLTAKIDPGAGTGTLGSTGHVGMWNWLGSGAWTMSDLNPEEFALDWDSEATLTAPGLPPPKKPDSHTIFGMQQFKDENGRRSGVNWGIVLKTENGVPVGIQPYSCSGHYVLTAGLNGTWDMGSGNSQLAVTFANNGSSFDVTGTVIPEPASLALLGLGALTAVRRRR